MVVKLNWKSKILGYEFERSKVLKPGHEQVVYLVEGCDLEDVKHQYHDGYFLRVISDEVVRLKSFQDYEVKPGMKPDPQILKEEQINDFEGRYNMIDESYKFIVLSYHVGGKERE